MGGYEASRKQTRRYFIEACKRMFGDKCAICNRTQEELQKLYPGFEYVLEHRNGNPNDYGFDNIQITCNSCNQRKKGKDHPATGDSVCVYENESETGKRRKMQKLRSAPIEIEINRNAEPIVRRYYWEQISRADHLFVEDAPFEAAEYAGCSPVTAQRILNKMLSRTGPFLTKTTPGGGEYLILRDSYHANPTTWTGQLDLEMFNQRHEALKAELADASEYKSANEAMQKKLASALNELDSYKKRLAQKDDDQPPGVG